MESCSQWTISWADRVSFLARSERIPTAGSSDTINVDAVVGREADATVVAFSTTAKD